jgi:hypothetical protein
LIISKHLNLYVSLLVIGDWLLSYLGLVTGD